MNNYFIYIRETGEKVPVTKEIRDAYYQDVNRIRSKEYSHGRCACPKKSAWMCNGDCAGCEFHKTGDMFSLNWPDPDGDGNLFDSIPDESQSPEESIGNRIILKQLMARLYELDPDADTIIRLWTEHPEGISDRNVAKELGRPQKTFADQMQKYRKELRKILEK